MDKELGDLSQPFLGGPKGSTGYIGTSRNAIERFHQLMINTGHTGYILRMSMTRSTIRIRLLFHNFCIQIWKKSSPSS